MDLLNFLRQKAPEITATAGLVAFAILKKKLTPGGVLAGIISATIHMLHPWPAFFWLLMVFFLFGTFVTKIGHTSKSQLTQSSTGGSGGEGARKAIQVWANSGWACLLILTHTYLLNTGPFISSHIAISPGPHSPILLQLLPIGIISQYAAVAADTFASELGILSQDQPFLITAPWKKVPKGTNGGVTIDGLKYSVLGSGLLTFVAGMVLFFAEPRVMMDAKVSGLLVVAGLVGSVIDSVLGALAQVTVTDKGTGKVVEGAGGQRVKVLPDGSRVQIGTDLLTNNGVNFVMASSASILAMGVAYVLDLQLQTAR
ncbi:Protein PGR [Pseudocercospora fuligena]|uniref:Protein PGR n=1 Tax=Pseudocercospora fuligena TaxID=685502 RepID=A0A8H6VFS3_9PEZI|nr:Protein PGR [Pseudocercospora fuligena]